MEGDAGRSSFRDDGHQLLAGEEQLALMDVDKLHGGGCCEPAGVSGLILHTILPFFHSDQTRLAAWNQTPTK